MRKKIASATFAIKSEKIFVQLKLEKLLMIRLLKGILTWGNSSNNKLGNLFKLWKKAVRVLADKEHIQIQYFHNFKFSNF